MNELSTLFTAIGDFFTQSDWFSMVQWPFWILLFTVAAGGVYCARFGKKTLINQGVSGVLNLLAIYLTAVIGYNYFPSLRSMFSELPFLRVTEQSVSLVDPFTLYPNVLAPVLLRLMILIFVINLCDTFGASGKTLLTWLFSQCITVAISLLFYTIITAGVTLLFPALLNRYAIIPVVVIVCAGILILCMKFVFTVIISSGNPTVSAIFRFFTGNRGGVLFTTSALSFLLSMLVLCALHLSGNTTLAFSNINTTGLWIILLLLLVALYIFGMFYNDKKKS